MDKRFIDAINADDFVTVRDMLKNRLLMDHDVNGGAFTDCWNECKKAGIIQNIFQSHDGRELSDEVSEKNYNSLVGQLATNFSELRLNKIISLAKKIWPNEQSEEFLSQVEAMKVSASSNAYDTENGKIVSERILEEKEMPYENIKNTSERTSYNRDKNDSNFGVVVAVAAAAVVAVVAGVVLLG